MVFKESLAALLLALPLVLASPSPVQSRATLIPPACQFLVPIRQDLIANLFHNICADTAHGALRLSFHDAIGISPTLGGGGADGSFIIFNSTELLDPGNVGLDSVIAEISPFFFKNSHVISPGDFIQFAGALSLSVCPGAPKVKFVIGRPQPTAPAPNFIIPQPVNTTDELINFFQSVGFSPAELVALLASHTVAGADSFSPPLEGVPFDSTPDVFDTNIFIDVLLHGTLFPQGATRIEPGILGTAINGTIRLQSDFELARDSRTACTWQSFAVDHNLMSNSFASAFFKMGLLGQANNPNLVDCTSVITPPPSFNDVIQFPPQQFLRNVEQSCAATPFPNLTTAPGPALNVSPIVQTG